MTALSHCLTLSVFLSSILSRFCCHLLRCVAPHFVFIPLWCHSFPSTPSLLFVQRATALCCLVLFCFVLSCLGLFCFDLSMSFSLFTTKIAASNEHPKVLPAHGTVWSDVAFFRAFAWAVNPGRVTCTGDAYCTHVSVAVVFTFTRTGYQHQCKPRAKPLTLTLTLTLILTITLTITKTLTIA